MSVLNKMQGRKPPGGAMRNLGGRQVASLGGTPPIDKYKDPHTLERVADIEVAPHQEAKEDDQYWMGQGQCLCALD